MEFDDDTVTLFITYSANEEFTYRLTVERVLTAEGRAFAVKATSGFQDDERTQTLFTSDTSGAITLHSNAIALSAVECFERSFVIRYR